MEFVPSMPGLPDAKIAIVRSLVEQSPDQVVNNLHSALAAVEDDTALAGVRRLVEAEVADRKLRNMVLEPVAPLFGRNIAPDMMAFPPKALSLIWKGLKVEAPIEVAKAARELVDYRPDESSTETFDLLVTLLAQGLETAQQPDYVAAINLIETAKPGGLKLLLSCLAVSPTVRASTLRLPEWISRTTDERAAAARLAYKDVGLTGEDAGPRFFEMLGAQLAEPWMILRVISAVMHRPAEAYLAGSELAVFALRVMDAIDVNLKKVATFDLNGGPKAGLAAADVVETITLQITEIENSIELARETGWGHRVHKQKTSLAAVVEGRLRELDKVLANALPNHKVRVARMMKTEARLTDMPDERAVDRCRALLAFAEAIRGSANYGGFASTRAKVMESAGESLDNYVEEVLSSVRDGYVPDREIAGRFLQIAAEFAGPIHEPRAGDIVRRRAATAFSVSRREPLMLDDDPQPGPQ